MAIMGRPRLRPKVYAVSLCAPLHGRVAARDQPVAQRQALSAADLAPDLFIPREDGSGMRYLDPNGDGQVFQTVEKAAIEPIKQSDIAGPGIAVIALRIVTAKLNQGRPVLLRAPHLPIIRHWFPVRLINRHQTAAGAEKARSLVALNRSNMPD